MTSKTTSKKGASTCETPSSSTTVADNATSISELQKGRVENLAKISTTSFPGFSETRERKKMTLTYQPSHVPAVLRANSSWYIEYYYTNSKGSLVRVRHNLNRILKRFRKVADRRAYAQQEVARINLKLQQGWTPEAEERMAANSLAGTPWADVKAHYLEYLGKQEKPYKMSHSTALTYRSTFGIFCSFVETVPTLLYIYMIDDAMVRRFLDWSMAVRKVSETTRDNYRRWLHSFCSWLVDCGYLQENPVEKVKPLTGGHHTKQQGRDAMKSKYISERDRVRMFRWMDENDPWLKLAVLLCHECFLRTKEVAQLRVENIRLHDSLIFVPAAISKNKTDAFVTLTDEVARLMVELGVLEKPGHWFIFSRDLRPAEREKPTRGDEIRERWRAMCDALGMPKDVWFYHMKHTGITDMAAKITPRQVQLQARHHSIEMTERYMQETEPKANEEIRRWRGEKK